MWKLVNKLRCFRNKLCDVNPKQPSVATENKQKKDDYLVTCGFANNPEFNESNFRRRSSPKNPSCSLYEAVSWSAVAIIGIQAFFQEKKRKQYWILKEHHNFPSCPFGQRRPHLPRYDADLGRGLTFNVFPSSSSTPKFASPDEEDEPADEGETTSFSFFDEEPEQDRYRDASSPVVEHETLSRTGSLEEAAESLEAAENACAADIHNELGLELFAAEDAAGALEFFEAGCALGNEKACYNAGVCYEQGIGTQPDVGKAMNFYQLAADKNHLNAIYNLGTLLYEGKAGSKDVAKAKSLFLRAAERGLTEAQRTLGICHLDESNSAEAIPFLRAAAKQEDEEAQYYLGLCLENGWGVKEDVSKAAFYYRKAAAKNHPHATYNLGVLTEFGLGVPRRPETALDLYRDAAKAGSEEAKRRVLDLRPTESTSSEEASPLHPLGYSASFPNLHSSSPACTYLSKSNSFGLIHTHQFQSELVSRSLHSHSERNVQIVY